MFGGGEHGQLGLDDFVNRLYPTEVNAFVKIRRKVVSITLGWSHSVALTIHPETKAMEVYTFGNGDHGKLGHGDITRKAVPQLVRGLVGKHVYCVASYNEHTSALCSPGGSYYFFFSLSNDRVLLTHIVVQVHWNIYETKTPRF
jgi:alpha-tubulin suppressor-like RCC1 family protein